MAFLAKDPNQQEAGASGFYNLDRWLNANKGGGQILGNQISKEVGDANQQFKSSLDSANNSFKTGDFAGSATDREINKLVLKFKKELITQNNLNMFSKVEQVGLTLQLMFHQPLMLQLNNLQH